MYRFPCYLTLVSTEPCFEQPGPGEYYVWVPFNTKLRARVKITPREERHLFSREVFFTHARFSLPLLSLRKNGDYSKSGMNSTTTYL